MTPELQPVRFYATLNPLDYGAFLSNPTVDVFNTRFPTNGEIGDNVKICRRLVIICRSYFSW